jgi:hypothetical protein
MVDPVTLIMKNPLRDSTTKMRRNRAIAAMIPVTMTNQRSQIITIRARGYASISATIQ